jgi:hypothetical protein
VCVCLRARSARAARCPYIAYWCDQDQYAPEQLTLFTRLWEEYTVGVTTDGAAKRMLLTRDAEYAEWHDPGPDDTVLLVVSAMNDEESKLMVLPAVHSPPIETVLSHLAGAGAHARDGCAPQTHTTGQLQRLTAATPSLFDALPLPSHVDDWLAQVSSQFRV